MPPIKRPNLGQQRQQDLIDLFNKNKVNYQEADFTIGSGEFAAPAHGVMLNQKIGGRDIQTGIFFGDQGATYVRNPENRAGFRVVGTRVTLDEIGMLHREDPLQRIMGALNEGVSVRGRLQGQGAEWVPASRYVAQPNLENVFASRVDIGARDMGAQQSILNQLNQGRDANDPFLRFGKSRLASPASSFAGLTAEATWDDGSGGSVTGLALRKVKDIRLQKGEIAGILRRNDRLALEEEPFFFQNQNRPNKAFNLTEGFGMFFPVPEGQGYTRDIFPYKNVAKDFQMPAGTNLVKDTDGNDAFELPNKEIVKAGTYFGKKFGRVTQDYTRAGGAGTFRDIFGTGMKSFQTTLIDEMKPIMDPTTGAWTGRASVNYLGVTDEMSEKYMGTKANIMRVLGGGRGVPDNIGDVDIYNAFPSEDQLPGFALQALKGNLRTRDRFTDWFTKTALGEGRDQAWINANLNDGQVSREAAPMVTRGAIDFVMANIEQRTYHNVTLGPQEFDALRDATFKYGGQELPVIPRNRGNIKRVKGGGAVIKDFNDLYFQGEMATNVRTENARDTMSFKAGTLNLLSQYNPELFESMMVMGQENMSRNRSLNLAASYRANYVPEQRQMVENTFGIQRLDPSEISDIQHDLLSKNSSLGGDALQEGIMGELRNRYGNKSLEAMIGGESLVLPSAATHLADVTKNRGQNVNNWASKSMALISSLPSSSDEDLMTQAGALVGDNNQRGSYAYQANRRGVLRSASAVQVDRLGGIAHGIQGLEPNEVIASRENLIHLTGINEPALSHMAASGELSAAVGRYPPSDIKHMFANAKISIYENQDDEFRKTYKNPGRGLYVSPELQSSVQGDFDADRLVSVVNAMAARGGSMLTSGALHVLGNSEIMKRAKNKFESEYDKRIERYAERSGFDVDDVRKRFQDPKNLFRTLSAEVGSKFQSEEGAGSKGRVGIVYNTLLRNTFGAINTSTQAMFGTGGFTKKASDSMSTLYHYAAQGLLDTKNTKTTAMQTIMDVASFGSRYISGGKEQYGVYRPGQAGENFATGDEAFFQKMFQNFVDIGSEVGQDEYEKTGLRRAVATSLVGRRYAAGMNEPDYEAHMGKIEALLDRSRKGENVYNDILGLTGPSVDPTDQQRYSVWGRGTEGGDLGDLSIGAEMATGSIAARRFLVDEKKGKGGAFPNGYQWAAAGVGGVAARLFNPLVEKWSKGLEGGVGAGGGTGPMRSFMDALFPGAADGLDAFKQKFRNVPADLFGQGYLSPSQWSFSRDKDINLAARTAYMNTSDMSGGDRSAVLDQLQQMGVLDKSVKTFFGYSGGGNAKKQGEDMEALLMKNLNATRGKKGDLQSQITIPENMARMAGGGRIDLFAPTGTDASGVETAMIADIKTKDMGTLYSDILTPNFSPQIGAQLGLYMEGATGFSDTMIGGQMVSGSKAAVLFGVRDSSLNPTDDQMMGGFETGYNEATKYWSNTKAPAGWDQAQWDQTRSESLAYMKQFKKETGISIGARVVSGAEALGYLDDHGAPQDARVLNQQHRSKGIKERAQQIADMIQGKTPSSASPPGGTPPPTTPTGTSAATPDPNDPSAGTGMNSAGMAAFIKQVVAQVGGGGTRISAPDISAEKLYAAAKALDVLTDSSGNLTEAAKGLTSAQKDQRDEMLKHYDAIKTVADYISKVDYARTQGVGATPSSARAFEGMFGASGMGRKNAAGVLQSVSSVLSDAALQGGYQSYLEGDGETPSGPTGIMGRITGGVGSILDRAIKGQGLFRAHMAWNMLGGGAFNQAQEYQENQAGQAMTLYQSGGINYQDLMGGEYGNITRRQARAEQARLGFGQQVLAAYQPFINFAMTSEITQGPLGAAAAIGAPALGAGIAAGALLGTTAGWAVAGGTALVGALGYGQSAANPQSALEKYNLGKKQVGQMSTFEASLGQSINQNGGFQRLIYGADPDRTYGELQRLLGSDLGIPSTAQMQQSIAGAPQINQDAAQLFDASNLLMAGMSYTDVKRHFPNVNMGEVRLNAFNQTIQGMGAYQGMGADESNAILGDYLYYNREIPQPGDIGGIVSAYRAGGSSKDLASNLAMMNGLNVYDPDVMASTEATARAQVNQIQGNGGNVTRFKNEIGGIARATGPTNSLLRRAGLSEWDPDMYKQYVGAYTQDRVDRYDQSLQSRAMLKMTNGLYYQQYGATSMLAAGNAFLNGNEELGTAEEQNAWGGEQLFNRILANGGDLANMDLYNQAKSPQARFDRDQIQSGNRFSISRRAQMNGQYGLQTMNTDTGMGAFYFGVAQPNIDVLRQNSVRALPNGGSIDMFRLNDVEASFGQKGWQDQITATSRATETQQYWNKSWMRDASWGVRTGNMGQARQNFEALGMGFNQGNGMGYWQLEDAQRVLGRSQQMFEYGQGTQQLNLSEREFATQGQQFYAGYNRQVAQFNYNTQYQRQEMQIQQGQTEQQQAWQGQDIEFGRAKLDIHFAWQQQDYDRNIRYARGREKVDLMRQKSRSVIEYSMEAGQSDRQEERHDETVKWQREEFERRKEYFERNTQWQKEAMDDQKKFFEIGREYDRERLNMQQTAHQRQLFMMQEQWKLEDQRILLDRQNETLAYNNQVKMDTLVRTTQLEIQKWEDALNVVSTTTNEINGYIDILIQKGEILKALANTVAQGGGGVVVPPSGGGTPKPPASGGSGGGGKDWPGKAQGFPAPRGWVFPDGKIADGYGGYLNSSSGGSGNIGVMSVTPRPDMSGVVDPQSGIVPIQPRVGVSGMPSGDLNDKNYQQEVIRLLQIIATNPASFDAVISVPNTTGSPYLASKSRLSRPAN